MRRLITGDLQLDPNPRDSYRLDFLTKTLFDLVEKHQPEQLLILGDLTEQKDNHPASLVNMIVEAVSDLSSMCDIIFLQGNHDFIHKESPFFEFLAYLDHVEWIGVPSVKDNCLFLPHTRDYRRDWADIEMKGHDFIFAHNIFVGNNHNLDGIPVSIFPDDAFVIAGDIHAPQEFDVVTYCGAPYLCNFGDDYNPRVIFVDGRNVESIPLEGPQKRLIEASFEDGKIVVRNLAYPGDIVKIKCHIGKDDGPNWSSIKQDLVEYSRSKGFAQYTIVPVVQQAQGKRQKLVRGQHKSDMQFFEAYCARGGIEAKTAEIGRELLDVQSHS